MGQQEGIGHVLKELKLVITKNWILISYYQKVILIIRKSQVQKLYVKNQQPS